MKRRILLVDDELRILLTLKAVLEMDGFDVDTAASAREGIEKLADGPYHMIITDMKMETDRAGYDVIRAARHQEYDPAIAILTAYAASVGGDWRAEGAQSLLVKPIGTEDLLRQVEALLIAHEDRKQEAKPQTPPRVAASAQGRVVRKAS